MVRCRSFLRPAVVGMERCGGQHAGSIQAGDHADDSGVMTKGGRARLRPAWKSRPPRGGVRRLIQVAARRAEIMMRGESGMRLTSTSSRSALLARVRPSSRSMERPAIQVWKIARLMPSKSRGIL